MPRLTGRLAVLTAYGEPFELRQYDVPDPEPGAIVLRVTQSAICGSDLHVYRGDTANNPIPPGGRAVGHEGTGVVHKLGAGVSADAFGTPIQEGDRIVHSVITWGCKHCQLCLMGEYNLCTGKVYAPPAGTFPYFVGTFADYYYVPPGMPVFKVPEGLSDDVLAPVNCAMGTVTQGLMSAGAGEGQNIVIQGAGGLGLTGAAMAKDMGVDQVIVFDRLENRLSMAREFGADHTINVDKVPTAQERVELVRDLTRGRGADIVLELVGIPALLPEGVAMLRNGGTFVEIGLFFPGQTVAFDPSTLVLSGKKIIGSLMYKPLVLARILDFLVRNANKRPFERLISHHFELDKINEAFAQSEWQQTEETPVIRAALVP
jgi:D-arabinose 1-dehydrogenase-like Zn-dependent alcohol dehydrogenase